MKALRQRVTRLSQANLRINERLSFDQVLEDVLDSARYGVRSAVRKIP